MPIKIEDGSIVIYNAFLHDIVHATNEIVKAREGIILLGLYPYLGYCAGLIGDHANNDLFQSRLQLLCKRTFFTGVAMMIINRDIPLFKFAKRYTEIETPLNRYEKAYEVETTSYKNINKSVFYLIGIVCVGIFTRFKL